VALDNEESKAAIDAARKAYDALEETDRILVSNYEDLENAEKLYNSLAAAEEAKAAADKAAKDLETANGKVTKLEGQLEEAKNKVADYEQMAKALEDAKKELADAQKAATEANTALTQATNDLADTKTKLDEAETAKADAEKAKADAEAKYNALKESSNATEEDLAAAKLLIDAADKIIAEADEKIEGLNTKVSDLEAKVDELTKGKDAADEVVANAVIEKINNIGEVKKTNQSKYLIVSARSAYDTLTDDQKALVDNYDTLEDAEETYAALPQTGMSGAHKAFAGLAALIGAAGFGMFKLGKKKDEDQ
jgi:chromosome segregation ATPase